MECFEDNIVQGSLQILWCFIHNRTEVRWNTLVLCWNFHLMKHEANPKETRTHTRAHTHTNPYLHIFTHRRPSQEKVCENTQKTIFSHLCHVCMFLYVLSGPLQPNTTSVIQICRSALIWNVLLHKFIPDIQPRLVCLDVINDIILLLVKTVSCSFAGARCFVLFGVLS